MPQIEAINRIATLAGPPLAVVGGAVTSAAGFLMAQSDSAGTGPGAGAPTAPLPMPSGSAAALFYVATGILTGIGGILAPIVTAYFMDRREQRRAAAREHDRARRHDQVMQARRDAKDRYELELKAEQGRRDAKIAELEARNAELEVFARESRVLIRSEEGKSKALVNQLRENGSLDARSDPTAIMTKAGPSLLLVEDDPATAKQMAQLFTGLGFVVTEAGTVLTAREMLDRNPTPRWMALDLRLVDGSGLTLLQHVKESRLRTKVVVLTATTDPDILAAARALRPHAMLRKPIEPDRLAEAFAEPRDLEGDTPPHGTPVIGGGGESVEKMELGRSSTGSRDGEEGQVGTPARPGLP